LIKKFYSFHHTDLGSDLLDELEQVKHFPSHNTACQSIRQQLERLSMLTKQHSTLLEDLENKMNDCIELRQLEQQANEVRGTYFRVEKDKHAIMLIYCCNLNLWVGLCSR